MLFTFTCFTLEEIGEGFRESISKGASMLTMNAIYGICFVADILVRSRKALGRALL